MIEEVTKFQVEIYDYAKKKDPELFKKMREKRNIDEEMSKKCDAILSEYLKEIIAKRPKEVLDEDEKGDANVGVDVLDQATSKKKEEQKKK